MRDCEGLAGAGLLRMHEHVESVVVLVRYIKVLSCRASEVQGLASSLISRSVASQKGPTVATSRRSSGECAPRMVGP